MSSQLLEIGSLGKCHGLAGDIYLSLTTNCIEERTLPGSVLFCGETRLVISKCRPQGKRWVVSFEGVNTREDAEALSGSLLHGEPLRDSSQVFAHDLIGKSVVDQHGGRFSPVQALLANPASDLLELKDGQLIPFSFFLRFDDECIYVSVPDGLLSLPVAGEPEE